jgi:hypothetical protein
MANNMVDLHRDNPVTILNIAKGLATIIRRRGEQYTLSNLTIVDKIQDLEQQLDTYQETVPLPTSDHLDGYVLNDNARVPDFIVPCGEGEFQQAYWVKQLVEEQMAGLPWEYTLGQTLFVTEVYASLVKGQDNVMRPIHTLPGWLLALLTSPATHYGMLLKHVKATNNWGVVGEVLRFWQLKHHLLDLRLRIAHLKAKFRGVLQAQSASKGQLELAHLTYYAADFHVLSTLESHGEG